MIKTLTGNLVILRALEPEDLDFLYKIENNESFWEVSDTQTPFSRYLLKQYLENAHLDLYESKQLRLVIEQKNTSKAVGMIDLFDYNPQHKRCGIGLLVHPDYQNKGFASESLKLVIDYAFFHLHLHQLYANILLENTPSIKLFSNHGFQKIGVKKDWIFYDGQMKDEILFQRIRK